MEYLIQLNQKINLIFDSKWLKKSSHEEIKSIFIYLIKFKKLNLFLIDKYYRTVK